MKKCLLIALIFIFIITMSQTISAHSSTNLAENSFYYQGVNALNLDRSNLFLPDDRSIVNDEDKKFSEEGQEKLINLASQFDKVENSEGLSFNAELNYDDINLDKIITYNGEELETVELNNYENLNIKTNYEDNLDEIKSFLKTTFNFNYQLNPKATLRASYDLTNKTIENNIDEEVNNEVNDGNNESDDQKEEKPTETEEEESEEANESNENEKIEPLYDNLIDQQGKVGVSYQSFDNVIVSADYVKNNIFREIEGDSTVFGLEYLDEEGNLKARYEIIDGKESKETITGVELGLRDLATFSASYKLLGPNFIQSNGESIWDFGVDINFSESTQFSVDYQFSDKMAEDNSLMFKEKDSNINANFKINF
ncbi:MAG: hypothetical protein ACOCRO_01755 [Halanaerobiales bacterium]